MPPAASAIRLEPDRRARVVDQIRQLRGGVVASVISRGDDGTLAEFAASLGRSGLLADEAAPLPVHEFAIDPSRLPPPKKKFGRRPSMTTDPMAPSDEQKKMLAYLDKSIRLVNREIIHKQIPGLTRERFIEFAASVAKLRADYLKAAMDCFLDDKSDAEQLEGVQQKRALFEEGVKAYEALHRAIERGYIDPELPAAATPPAAAPAAPAKK
ncbi:MAG: hypothetical protein JNN22_08280 [Rhodospirillales bacterium]|nr:hypothetical protein [Rhodospirillales bacterium]